MIQESDVKAIERTESLLNLLKEDGDSVFKIISLVQENKKFFGAKLGSSCLKAASEKLQELVSAENGISARKDNASDRRADAQGESK